MSQAVGQRRRRHSRRPILAVPRGHTHGLLRTAVPLGRNDTEQRQAPGLK